MGCAGTFACSAPPCHKDAATGVVFAIDSAVAWQVSHFWMASCVEACFIANRVPEATSAFAASAISG